MSEPWVDIPEVTMLDSGIRATINQMWNNVKTYISGNGVNQPSKTIEEIVANIDAIEETLISIISTGWKMQFAYINFLDRAYKVGTTIALPPFTVFINGSPYKTTEIITLGTNNLDIGSDFTFGTDYYIYAGVSNGMLALCLSASATGSAMGYDHERIIGGFHYGKIRNSATPSDVSNGILDYSVWDLQNMPRCYLLGLADPSTYQIGGMVEIIKNKVWADIYLASDGGGTGFTRRVYSKINQLPLSGSDGLNWYDFIIRGANVGKRLLSYDEWTIAALGSPPGLDSSNLNGWTKTTNTGRVKTAATNAQDADSDYILGYNTSFKGCRDCVGNVYEWMRSTGSYGSDAFTNDIDTGELASIHEHFGQRLIARNYVCGGRYINGALCGARMAAAHVNPGDVSIYVGARFACDSL